MARKVTSFDVARRAGVSQPTVSRALRNLPGASPATRERIIQVASELAYIPSDSGRVLAFGNTRRIAVVSEELTNPYYPELVEPLRRELAQHDLRTVLITDTKGEGVDIGVLADGSYDGVILTTTMRNSSLPRDLTEHRIPHVLVNRLLDYPESPSCAMDNAAGAGAVAALLTDLGHVQVASIQGPTETSTGRERAEGLRAALKLAGIQLPRKMIRRIPFGHDYGLRAAQELLQLQDRPTAIVCGNDVIALGALSAARVAGIRVPQDMTIIGFDDIPMAAWPLVNLSTVHCDLGALAGSAVELLLAELAGPGHPPAVRRIPVSLMLRGTHAAPHQ